MEQIIKILRFVMDSFIHIWPYLVVTIPLAVAVNLSGASGLIKKALDKSPIISIVLATVVGAFSPFCSCGVIPVIASLLIGGVPLAPVMSFWIASPSMDPEIFFLSVATIGWKLSIWRLVATFIISLMAGYVTHLLFQKKVLGEDILKKGSSLSVTFSWGRFFSTIAGWLRGLFNIKKQQREVTVHLAADAAVLNGKTISCCIPVQELTLQKAAPTKLQEGAVCSAGSCKSSKESWQKKLILETWKASITVAKFMALAFFINAIIQFYVPQESISNLIGNDSWFSVFVAAFIGMPFYTSNLTALPLISGLLELGMNPAAALSFLISGPVTTLPAMAAVWGLVHKKIFLMYVFFALFGAVLFGLLYGFVG